ncbi:hypothetical protein HV824_26360 [Myxococcus sp. AM009]|uniref:hypothetical protein n=1 Tax=unclassified Myxococcus TaxID=2648731 RepID=UPI0015952EDA|nr:MULTISPECIES: hypothetical protein [unclassified Myxococcus]NVJ01619.1 hypothetical protein [Myxococcus sp. AM009]NVJ14511.1 hypothetical protein [Myxococcus sp. AM010]
MRQVRWGILGLATAAVAAAVGWSMWGATPEATPARVEAAEARPGSPADLTLEVRALRAELEALRRGQGHLMRRVESVGPPAPLPVPGEEAAPEPQAATPTSPNPATLEVAREERRQELEAELQAAAHTEPRDREWAGQTETLVTRAFGGADFAGSRLTRVDCRTRLCVLEVEHDAAEARAELLSSLMRVNGLQGQAVMRPADDGGRLTSRIYLSRAGEALPMTLRP